MSSSESNELLSLSRALRVLVEDQKFAGLSQAAMETASIATSAIPQRVSREEPHQEAQSLEAIRTNLGDCERCKLHRERKNIVFGVGNPRADLLFVGEAPGRDEDEQGMPFVGRAGKLLTGMIEAIGLSRDEVYICNVIKCRPPQNRNPEEDEIEECRPFLEAQISAVKPKVICTLGKFAAQTLLKTETPISKLRGVYQTYLNVPLMPTYHPAYLLRNPSAKKEVWEDLKLVHQTLCELTGKNIKRKGA